MASTGPSASERPLHVVLLLGGEGTRFSNEGYLRPKVLVRVRGQPMIYWALKALKYRPEDKVTILYHARLDQWHFPALIRHALPRLQVNFVPLRFCTRGAVESALVSTESLRQQGLDYPVCFIDADAIHREDVLDKARSFFYSLSADGAGWIHRKGLQATFYKREIDPPPIFSFVRLEGEPDAQHGNAQLVTKMVEKQPLSEFINIGIYCFSSVTEFRFWAKKVLDEAFTVKGEYYLSCVYALVLAKREAAKSEQEAAGLPLIFGLEANDYVSIGTPKQVQDYLLSLERGEFPDEPPNQIYKHLRICFDLDNTLVTYPEISGDYKSVKPVKAAVEMARRLKAGGATIIVNTARRMKTHNNNLGKIFMDQGRIILDTLERFEIPCDELYFGKPLADYYIDDLAVNPYIHFHEEMGLADLSKTQESSVAMPPFSDGGAKALEEFSYIGVPPQPYHKLRILKDTVVKTGPLESMRSEVEFFKNLPDSLKALFPRYLSSSLSSDGGLLSLEMSRAQGIPLSYCYVYRTLTPGQIQEAIESLRTIHQVSSSEASISSQDLYSSWASKLLAIQQAFPEVYSRFPSEPLHKAMEFLTVYQRNGLAWRAPIIHGDALFTNALIRAEPPRVTWVGMKTRASDSLEGDANQDWAKVLQSLSGFDALLLDAFDPVQAENEAAEKEFFALLLDGELLDWFKNKYLSWSESSTGASGDRAFGWLQVLTASLLFMSLPQLATQPAHTSKLNLIYRLASHLLSDAETTIGKL